MKRREFITLLAGASAWPLPARAQQPAKLPTVGLLGAATPATWSPFIAAFVRRLRELGWIEGTTIAIEYRWAEGRDERFAEIAAEFVRLKVDVIVTAGAAVLAAKQATSLIPIVFAVAADPVGGGLVASLVRPGGNVTGLSTQFTDLAGKRFELLREIVPSLRQLAIMANAGYPAAVLEMAEVQATARTHGIEVTTLEIRRAEDISPAFEGLKGRTEALYVCSDPLTTTHRVRINTLALAGRLPMMYGVRENVEAGRPDVIWPKLSGPVAARRRPRGQDSAWSEARRNPDRAANQVRSRHQSDDCQGARTRCTARAAQPRQRSDRMRLVFAAMHESGSGTKRTSYSCRRMSAFGGKADINGRQFDVCF
jgi:ABC transporter substrate binding protein